MPQIFLHKLLYSAIIESLLLKSHSIQFLQEFKNFHYIVGFHAEIVLVSNKIMLRLDAWFVLKWVYIELFGIYTQDVKEQ